MSPFPRIFERSTCLQHFPLSNSVEFPTDAFVPGDSLSFGTPLGGVADPWWMNSDGVCDALTLFCGSVCDAVSFFLCACRPGCGSRKAFRCFTASTRAGTTRSGTCFFNMRKKFEGAPQFWARNTQTGTMTRSIQGCRQI